MFKSNFKLFLAIAVLVNLFFIFAGLNGATGNKSVHAANSSVEYPQYIAYYFFNSNRCSSCYRIENWTKSTIQENFQQEISDGKLKWRAINIEDSEHRHFIQEFNLYSKSVVIVEQENGKQKRWKKLKKVWQLLGDKEKFFDYINSEVLDFMEEN